jgi:undecaprenyl-diphosphatase
VSFFNLLNGHAGVWPWLDTLARLYYIGAVPLLATALAAFLLLAPRREEFSPRWRLALATLLAVALCALLMAAINGFAFAVLGTDNLSPRPSMTRFVTPLIVEPNDNSFPAPEMMIAAALATALLAASPRAGLLGWAGVLLLGLTRLFCGVNYPADVEVGALLGAGLGALSLSALRVRLQLPARGGRRLVWRVRHQAVLSGGTVAGGLLVALYTFALMPRYQAHFYLPWSTPPATAAAADPVSSVMGEGAPSGPAVASIRPGHSLLDSEVMRLDGHLPRAEQLLHDALQEIALTHPLVGVNVAAIKAGTTGYRCAAVRFSVTGRGSAERRRVVATAARIVRRCFHADGQLRNVDVIGVVRQPADDGSITETTVFSASVQQSDLKLERGPAWQNWAKLDPGLWLRARSALYFDPQLLPAGGGPAGGGA